LGLYICVLKVVLRVREWRQAKRDGNDPLKRAAQKEVERQERINRGL
jgi:hypothetical protein